MSHRYQTVKQISSHRKRKKLHSPRLLFEGITKFGHKFLSTNGFTRTARFLRRSEQRGCGFCGSLLIQCITIQTTQDLTDPIELVELVELGLKTGLYGEIRKTLGECLRMSNMPKAPCSGTDAPASHTWAETRHAFLAFHCMRSVTNCDSREHVAGHLAPPNSSGRFAGFRWHQHPADINITTSKYNQIISNINAHCTLML